MLLLFDKGYKDFTATLKRKPVTPAEMRIWMRQRYKVNWSEAMTDMLYNTWVQWANTLNQKMAQLGFRRTGGITPQRTTIGMSTLADEISEHLEQREQTMRDDLKEIGKPKGGNLII